MKTITGFVLKALLYMAFAMSFASVSAQKTEKIIVYFKFNDYSLDAFYKSKIDGLIFNDNIIEVKIEAHCDSFGSNNYNDSLSLKRALEVKQYLLSKKIDEALIKIKAFGKRFPLNKNENDEERTLNRRADIVLVLKDNNTVKPDVPPKKDTMMVRKDTAILNIKNIEVGTSFKLENINFVGGRHQLLPKSTKTLQLLLNTLKTYPNLKIEIQGYVCCMYGDEDGLDFDTGTNDLSVNRAKAIYDYLILNGIVASRLSYKGYGASNKIVEYEMTEEDRTTNRRVEIKIINK